MPEKEEKPKTEEKKEEKPAPKDNLVETHHSLTIGGREIKYTVTAGTMLLKEETPDRDKEAEGPKPRAEVSMAIRQRPGSATGSTSTSRLPEATTPTTTGGLAPARPSRLSNSKRRFSIRDPHQVRKRAGGS